MFILKYKNFFLWLSVLIMIMSIASIFIFGLKKSIDFTGGARVVVEYPKAVSLELITDTLRPDFGEVKAQQLTSNSVKLSLRDMKESDYKLLSEDLNKVSNDPQIKEFSMLGPSVSSEVAQKAIIGFILVVLAIVAFITISFLGVSQAVSSFNYGIITMVALMHDTIIPVGVFAWLGAAKGVEVDSLFVVAILTILGVSMSDTIVIFDRIRENLKSHKTRSFEEVVGMSLDQSLVRSLATSTSVISVLLALYFFGPVSTKYFALTLTIGMFVGTYSSIFVASPLLVVVAKYFKNKVA